jgi:hypothetical protein
MGNDCGGVRGGEPVIKITNPTPSVPNPKNDTWKPTQK